MFGIILLSGCSQINSENKSVNNNSSINSQDNIISNTSSYKEGNNLEMTFNNTKNIVILNFKGEIIELKGQNPASGIWYKNESYELIGKEDDIELTKNGEIIFKIKQDYKKIIFYKSQTLNIKISEGIFYQKLTDLYSLSVDKPKRNTVNPRCTPRIKCMGLGLTKASMSFESCRLSPKLPYNFS